MFDSRQPVWSPQDNTHAKVITKCIRDNLTSVTGTCVPLLQSGTGKDVCVLSLFRSAVSEDLTVTRTCVPLPKAATGKDVCVLSLLNPLLGAAWPIVYFLQGRLGMAASFTRAYRFVWPAIVAKHLWCEQPVKEIQLTSICYVQICVYSSSYGDFLQWIDRRSAAFADSTRSDRDIFIWITIAFIYSSPMNGHC